MSTAAAVEAAVSARAALTKVEKLWARHEARSVEQRVLCRPRPVEVLRGEQIVYTVASRRRYCGVGVGAVGGSVTAADCGALREQSHIIVGQSAAEHVASWARGCRVAACRFRWRSGAAQQVVPHSP